MTGFRFAPGSPEGLRKAVKQLEETERLDPRAVFEEQYTPEKNYEILKNIYDHAERNKSIHA